MNKIRNFKEKSFNKQINTLHTRPHGGGGLPYGVSISSGVFFYLRAWRGGSTIENLTLIVLFSKYLILKHHGNLWSKGTKLRLVLRCYWEFLYKYKINFEGMLN